MLQLEKENKWSLRLSPIFFTGFTYSRIVACCGYLTSNQKFKFTQRTSKKQSPNFIPLLWEEKNGKKWLVRNFPEVRNFAWHLATETYLTERFVKALEAEPQVYRRILNTICLLGTTPLQSGTLIPKLVKAR